LYISSVIGISYFLHAGGDVWEPLTPAEAEPDAAAAVKIPCIRSDPSTRRFDGNATSGR